MDRAAGLQGSRASGDLAEQVRCLAPRLKGIWHLARFRAKVSSIHLDTGRTNPPAKNRVEGPLPSRSESTSDSGRLLPRDSTYTVCSEQPGFVLPEFKGP